MAQQIIKGDALPNIPWEDRPEGCSDVVWRSERNPIIKRDEIKTSNSIFNSAVVPFEGKFAGVFRCDTRTRRQELHVGHSDDGVKWRFDDKRIHFKCDDPEIGEFAYAYDPRVIKIEDKYYVHWCNGYHGPTIGIGYTTDFKEFTQIENAYLPCNRNGALFPRKIGGKYAMYSRPSDNGHTPFGDIFYSESPDMIHWGCHRHVMSPSSGWQSTKVGAGPCPIETEEGWLLIYHGVLNSCNGFVYSWGAALMDLEKPWKTLYRTKSYLMSPQTLYECVGDVPNVAFPCAALIDPPSGKMAIYYGCADTVVGMCFAYAHEMIDFVKRDSQLVE